MKVKGKIMFKSIDNLYLLEKLRQVGISAKKNKEGYWILDFECREYLNANTLSVLQSAIKGADSDILSADIEVTEEIWRYRK